MNNISMKTQRLGKKLLDLFLEIFEVFTTNQLNKRTRLSLSLLTSITFFLSFKGSINDGLGELILLGVSVIYGVFVLRATGTRDYATFFSTIAILSVFTLFICTNISDQNLYFSVSKSFTSGTFIGFVILGTPMIFISMFLMKKNTRKTKRLAN